MASMMEEIAGALGGENLGALAGMFGTDKDVMGKAVAAALPALMGGLARNSREPAGAEALFGALSKGHNGSILDSLGSILGGNNQWAQQQSMSTGEKILGHVLGGGRPRVEQQVAQSSGMQASLVAKLLPILAPIVLGYLGKKISGGGTDAGGLAASLQQERAAVQKDDGVLGGLLDMLDGPDDNQGGGGLMDVAGDLLTGPAGRSILGKLLGG